MAALSPRPQLPRHRTRCTETSGAFAAAAAVASARMRPGRGASAASESAASVGRQVMHTKTVARSPDSTLLIRSAPDIKLGVRNRCESVDADSHAVEYLDRCRGTPPSMRPMGWQVSWLAGHCNLPPSRPATCGTDISGFGQVLTAYSCGGSRGIASECSTRTTFPHRSFARKRPSRALVQRCGGALSMDRPCGRGWEDYCRGWGDALPWRPC